MVAKVWVNHDTDLMNLTIHANGKTSIIHSTQHHPFWNATRHAWIEADQLKPGEQLHTTNGTTATVASTTTIPGAADMWDLTITTTHNFYIATTTANILVHNCPVGHGDHQFPSVRPQASQFFDQVDLDGLTDTVGMTGYKQPNGNYRYVKQALSDVGVDATTGLPTGMYTVIRRGPQGAVVTLYPGTSAKG